MSLVRVKARVKGVTGYINCMRGSWLGNPFPVNRYDLELSLKYYRDYLYWRIDNDEVFKSYLLTLRKSALYGKVYLGCTCKLEAKCHVDVLIDIIREVV